MSTTKPTHRGGRPAALIWSLRAGSLYFFSVAIAHWLPWRVPVLYVYFDVPSNVFQDVIIGVLAFGWGLFLGVAASNESAREILAQIFVVAGLVAVGGLAVINMRALALVLEPAACRNCHWAITAGMSAYLAWIALLVYLREDSLEVRSSGEDDATSLGGESRLLQRFAISRKRNRPSEGWPGG